MFDFLLNLIYPNKCEICGKIITDNSKEHLYYTCKKCKRKLKYYLSDNGLNLKPNFYIDIHFSLFQYKGLVRELLINYKFNSHKYLYKLFSYSLYDFLNELIPQAHLSFDYIIAVPISFQRFLERGYNQSALVAKDLAKFLNKSYLPFCLIKVKHNKRQSTLSIKERASNTKDVYSVMNSSLIYNKTILLVDDIYTTGSTLNECSKILKEHGAKEVIAITIAKA